MKFLQKAHTSRSEEGTEVYDKNLETRLLQKGDIIRLEKGMKVYAKIPEMFCCSNKMFCCSNRNFSTEIVETVIEIGQRYCREHQSKEQLINRLMECINSVICVTENQIANFVKSLNLDFEKKELDTSIYAGEYVVDWVTKNGGETQLCMSGSESYQDGWHVYCTKTEEPSVHVHFYQTGCFTATIPDIQPINSNIPDWLQDQKDI